MSLTESSLHPETAAFRHVIPAGEPFLCEVKAGQTVRLLDLEGNQAVDTLFFSAKNPRERYDPQRTLRKQNSVYLTTGTVLYSNLGKPLLTIEGNPPSALMFTVSRNLADAMATAERRLEVQDANLVRYSLLSLPLQAQETYRILLMVPIGAFIMLLLRNLVGIKTYGTFMPVLIALAFRETALVAGVTLFVLVVGFGLLVRFYLERLRLLLVPRLTAILILVVLLMAAVSVLSNRLGLEVGLSVALFPMVIMAMTIERMSVAWDERGAGTAIREGVGTLVVAALAYLVMSWQPLEHLVFVFPEVLLVLFAAALLLGRYSGYRLNELLRVRALAREPDPIVPPPAADDATDTAASQSKA